jgi:hypothetical protein
MFICELWWRIDLRISNSGASNGNHMLAVIAFLRVQELGGGSFDFKPEMCIRQVSVHCRRSANVIC